MPETRVPETRGPETSQTQQVDADVPGPQAAGSAGNDPVPSPVVVDDLTIEDVSIDGMCGVY